MARFRLTSTDLRRVKDEATLFTLLRRLGWPLIDDDDALTYPITDVGSVNVRQLLPFAQDDPWLILLVEYQGPFRRDDVRKTLREVRKLQRQQGKYEGKGIADILFICVAQGYEEIEFVRFIERGSRQPKLRVFGWSPHTTNQNKTVCDVCLPALALETTAEGLPDWSLARWSQAWDVEKVTKDFFKGFGKLREKTLEILQPKFGDDEDSANWAVSIQLNRLLFVYFLADQGFLTGGVGRLASALGRGSFHEWFQTLTLEALGKPGERPKGFEDVQYMNGGLFVLHETEEGRELELPNDHYRDWLAFLGKFRWTLSENEGVNTISPHILGYLFERYINQKQMGAYYTKEDVTGYICRSTIVPRLFDKVAEALGRDAVHLDIGAMSQEGNRRYIFPSVKQNAFLPTETTYEYGRRMERLGLLERLELREVDDFVTNNLDLELLAEDWLATRKDPKELLAAYDALQSITILDPTVGSGAFLLAALEILAPIYDVALRRMEQMVKETGQDAPDVNWAGELNLEEALDQKILADPQESKVIGEMRARLTEVAKHPNSAYFVRKRILLNNLFGVDIMPEAVEICKLRLYLALVSVAEPQSQLEPLPDVDLNYRAGNALVGFATRDEVREGLNPAGTLNLEWAEEIILQRSIAKIEEINELQEAGLDASDLKLEVLAERAAAVGVLDLRQAEVRGMKLDEDFRRTHRPFNWIAEFPHILLRREGFDVVVGNPPWVEMEKIKDYKVVLGTVACGNLYAPCFELSVRLSGSAGRVGMIVPVSASATESYAQLRSIIQRDALVCIASFNDRPSRLFEGLEHCRSCIILRNPRRRGVSSTGYLKWSAHEREDLTQRFGFVQADEAIHRTAVGKLSDSIEVAIWRKMRDMEPLARRATGGHHVVYYTRKLSYFTQVLLRPPQMLDARGRPRQPSELKTLHFSSSERAVVAFAALNSSLFYWFLTLYSDCRNLNRREVLSFPLGTLNTRNLGRLVALASRLDQSLQDGAELKKLRYRQYGEMTVECFYPRLSKTIIDSIDTVLAAHYGLTDEEVDYIVQYDYKYRMGQAILEEAI